MSDPAHAADGSGLRPDPARHRGARGDAAIQGPSRPLLGRRLLLAAAAGLAARPVAVAGPGVATGTVFMDLSQSALDDAYTQSVWAPDAPAIIAGYARDSAAVRAAMPPRTERYGPGAAETLDLFIEPPRVSRRLQLLRGWSDDDKEDCGELLFGGA